jgi:RNA repair pathway DNA polymerase beta family
MNVMHGQEKRRIRSRSSNSRCETQKRIGPSRKAVGHRPASRTPDQLAEYMSEITRGSARRAYDGHAMDLRLKQLAELDRHAVPLPHGTEVITGVDRVVGERTVPQGTVGRVMRSHGDGLDVAVVGVGTLRYARRELTPRRLGQALFAVRRAAAWESLAPCTVLTATVGSRAWGLADDGSDVDRRGVFALPLPWTLGLVAPPEDLVSADGSSTYWSAGKAIRQALRADPNTLEMLFVREVEATDEMGAWLLAERDAFVSSEIFGSFGRYALAQLRRLEQNQRLAEHRTLVLAWLRADASLGLDAVAVRLARASGRAFASDADAVHQAREYVKQLYRSLADQGLLAASDFASLAAFARERAHEFELPRELRPKNAYNLLRLIAVATEWLRTGLPELEVHGALRDRLLAIKRGEVALADVIADAEAMVPDLEAAKVASKLPARPDVARADALFRRIGEELARRWTTKTPGPFGRDAREPPPIAWDDA